MGDSTITADDGNPLFQHEYGHYLQSYEMGRFYLMKVAIPSLFSKNTSESPHHMNTAEQDANIMAFKYFKKYYPDSFDTYDTNGKYTGAWAYNINPIAGFDWNNYSTNVLDNNSLLYHSPLDYYWYDHLLVDYPVLGDLIGGLVNTADYNTKY